MFIQNSCDQGSIIFKRVPSIGCDCPVLLCKVLYNAAWSGSPDGYKNIAEKPKGIAVDRIPVLGVGQTCAYWIAYGSRLYY